MTKAQLLRWLAAGALSLTFFVPCARADVTACQLDIDADGQVAVETDVALLMAYLLGLRDQALIEGSVGRDGSRTSASDIEAYLSRCRSAFDIDLDGVTHALSDGILLWRFVAGWRGEALFGEALSPDSPGQDPREIEIRALELLSNVGKDATERALTQDYFAHQFSLTLDNLYWGEFHAHTSYSADAAVCGALDPAAALDFADDPARGNLDFVALSDHAEMPNEDALPPNESSLWNSLIQLGEASSREASGEPDPFIVFPGWEYTNTIGLGAAFSSARGYGHKNVVFRSPGHLPIARIGAFLTPRPFTAESADDLWEMLADFSPSGDDGVGDALTIIHTPAQIGDEAIHDHRNDWEAMDARFSRHVELLSKWGNSEGLPHERANCALIDEPLDHDWSALDPERTVRCILFEKWVEQGDPRYQIGFVGGTDTHDGQPGSPQPSACDAIPGELRGAVTGIAAPIRTRDTLWDALWRRHTLVATAGGQLPVLMAVDCGGDPALMGEALSCAEVPLLYLLADPTTEAIEIVLDGCVIARFETNVIHRFSLPSTNARGFVYARAIRGATTAAPDQSWTSPVYMLHTSP